MPSSESLSHLHKGTRLKAREWNAVVDYVRGPAQPTRGFTGPGFNVGAPPVRQLCCPLSGKNVDDDDLDPMSVFGLRLQSTGEDSALGDLDPPPVAVGKFITDDQQRRCPMVIYTADEFCIPHGGWGTVRPITPWDIARVRVSEDHLDALWPGRWCGPKFGDTTVTPYGHGLMVISKDAADVGEDKAVWVTAQSGELHMYGAIVGSHDDGSDREDPDDPDDAEQKRRYRVRLQVFNKPSADNQLTDYPTPDGSPYIVDAFAPMLTDDKEYPDGSTVLLRGDVYSGRWCVVIFDWCGSLHTPPPPP